MSQALKAWGPAAIWAAVLFLLSEKEPSSSGLWMLVNDKVAHVGLYAVLGATLAWGGALQPREPPRIFLVGAGIAYGILDEWHQSFVPGRTPSAGDLVADAAGVFLGVWITHALLTRQPWRGSQPTS